MALVYATDADLTAWMAPTALPANSAQLLRTASFAVREFTETAYYACDTTGMPTDPVQLQAFKDATCAQAAAMASFQVDPLAGGVLESSLVESAVGIGTAKISYGDAAAAVQGQLQLLNGLVLEAARILRQAGLVVTAPWVVG